jgi:hypothetical protein
MHLRDLWRHGVHEIILATAIRAFATFKALSPPQLQLHFSHELAQGYAQRLCKMEHVDQGDIPFASFHVANVVAMDSRQLS